MIKLALKEWHGAHAQNLPSRIDGLKVRISALEGKEEEDVLSEAEIEELHGIT
ncbi:endonuclease/exonuclease/phosphatase family protein, partial [Trifolium medium]|nr:endonuclease/exonuclease/phosphatase family protein [Trifolium medium]